MCVFLYTYIDGSTYNLFYQLLCSIFHCMCVCVRVGLFLAVFYPKLYHILIEVEILHTCNRVEQYYILSNTAIVAYSMPSLTYNAFVVNCVHDSCLHLLHSSVNLSRTLCLSMVVLLLLVALASFLWVSSRVESHDPDQFQEHNCSTDIITDQLVS